MVMLMVMMMMMTMMDVGGAGRKYIE